MYKRQAQGAAGAAAKTAQASAAAAKKAAKESKKGASFLVRHWKGALLIGGVGLLLLMIMGGLQSCTAMFGGTGTGLAATSYLSEDADMLGAEVAYAELEADLQHELDNYESLHHGYDEYRFDPVSYTHLATQAVVNQSAGVIIGETSIDFDTLLPDLESRLEAMDIGPLLSLWFQTLVVVLTMNILSICIFLVTYGRMIEIYALSLIHI